MHRGVAPSGKVAGGSQQSRGPEVCGGGGEYAQIFGSRGGGSCQDVLIKEEAVRPFVSDKDLEVCATYKKATKQGAGQKGRTASPNVVGIKRDGVGRR